MPFSRDELEKLGTAMIAANDGSVRRANHAAFKHSTDIVQVNIRQVADYMGTTYNALEKRLRPLKDEARKMRGEAPRTPKKQKSAKRKRSGTLYSMTTPILTPYDPAAGGSGCNDKGESPTKKRKGTSRSLPSARTSLTLPDDPDSSPSSYGWDSSQMNAAVQKVIG